MTRSILVLSLIHIFMGISKASERVADLSGEAVALLDSLGRKNEFLDTLVRELVGRRK